MIVSYPFRFSYRFLQFPEFKAVNGNLEVFFVSILWKNCDFSSLYYTKYILILKRNILPTYIKIALNVRKLIIHIYVYNLTCLLYIQKIINPISSSRLSTVFIYSIVSILDTVEIDYTKFNSHWWRFNFV